MKQSAKSFLVLKYPSLKCLSSFLDSHIKVYKKKIEGDSVITTKVEGTLNASAEKLFKMMTDLPTMQKCDLPLKNLKCVEQHSRNSDTIYFEMKVPFPMSNRDILNQRIYLGNKEDSALVKELGLYDWGHTYYVILNQSVERADCPPQKGIVRANTKMNFWLIEEDQRESGKTKVTQVVSQDMGGSIPASVLNSIGAKGATKRFEGIMENYGKLYKA